MKSNSSQLLITETGHAVLDESVEVRPGCLGTLRGPAADLTEPTRNRRYYSRHLWENVFNTPWVQEAFETKTLFGEVDHPTDRLETKVKEAAIVLTGYDFNDTTNTLDATFDILDTPGGRIIKALADYGSKIGVSSRGRGNLVKKGDMQIVKEDSYIFAGFDAVALPAVKRARQIPVTESVTDTKESVIDSLSAEINECKSVDELASIQSVLQTSGILSESSELDTLLKNKDTELKNEPQGNTIVIEGLKKDLGDAYAKIAALESQENHTNTIDMGDVESRHTDDIQSCLETVLSLVEENSSIKDSELSMRLALNDRDSTINSLREQVSQSHTKLTEAKLNNSANSSTAEELEHCKSLITKLRESNSQYKTDITEMQSELEVMREEYDSAIDQVDSSNHEINEVTDTYNELAEKYNSLYESQESLKSDHKITLETYAKARCLQAGLTESSVLPIVENCTTVQEIENIVSSSLSEKVRMSTLSVNTESHFSPTTDARLVTESTNTVPDGLEEAQVMLQAFPHRNRPKINKR